MNVLSALSFISKRLIGSLIVSILCVIIFAPYGSAIRNISAPLFKSFLEKRLACHAAFDMISCNLINPSIELHNLIVHPPTMNNKGIWSWHCKRYRMSFSWLRFFKTGKLELTIEIDGLDACSAVFDKKPAIKNHLEKLLQPSAVAYVLKFLNLGHMHCLLYDHERQTALHFISHSSSRKIDNIFKSKINIVDGSFSMYQQPMITDIVGTLSIDLTVNKESSQINARLDSRITTPTNGIIYFLSGHLEDEHGRFAVRTADNRCSIDPIIINQKDQTTWLQMHAQIPLEQIQTSFPAWSSLTALPSIKGLCALRLCAALDMHLSHLDAYVLLDNVSCGNIEKHAVITSSLHKRNTRWTTETSVRMPSLLEFKGIGSWESDKQQLSCSINNLLPIPLTIAPHWHIDTINCQLATNSNGIIEGPFVCKAVHNLIQETLTTDGIVSIKETEGTLQGNLLTEHYTLTFSKQFPFIKNIRYETSQGGLRAQLDCKAAQIPYTADLHGTVEMALLSSLFKRWGLLDLQADGAMIIKGTISNTAADAYIKSQDVTVRLPHTYNIAKHFSGNMHYVFDTNRLVISDLVCAFDQSGTIQLPHGIIDFNQLKKMSYICAPILINHCLFNIHHDLFARISGSLLLQQLPEQNRTLSGHFVIDKSQLKENILAQTLQQKLSHHARALLNTEQQPTIACSFSIETRDPMHVKTNFLDAQALTKLSVKGTIANPEISGNVRLLSGNLTFPYKPLYITKGSLLFIPEQSSNPLIELTAKNVIKKHAVTLHVTGSLHDQHLLFESTPPLSEEQIISLLFVGSAQDSLNVMAPALLMNNMQKLMFGTTQSSVLDRYFKSFVKPFSINLVPSFADQTGRGGLRGALEIDVNDRLRATIQKNFSLSEDTRFEIEYAATEDITIRGIRNERRDLGGEIEMRWKF